MKSLEVVEVFCFRVFGILKKFSERLNSRALTSLLMVSGPPHSGTSILAQTIGNLPDCDLINYETGFFVKSGMRLKILPMLFSSKKKFLVEKTPMHLHRIEGVLDLLPDSKHLVIYRDPKDTVASVLMRLEGDFDAALKSTLESFQEVLRVSHLRQVKIVSYEQFVVNKQETLNEICTWLGISLDLSVLDVRNHLVFFGEGSGKLTSGYGVSDHVLRRRWQVRQPFFDGRFRHASILTPNQVEVIDSEFREVFRSLTLG
jgi:hypothetical protein